MNHTPTRSRLPWKLSRGWKPSRGNKIHAKKFALLTSDAQQAADGMLTRGVAVAVGINPEDAAFIVRACNAHDALVSVLRAVQTDLLGYALDKFDWSKSALDAKAIRILNEIPGKISAALKLANKV